jgi:hypothetical protein
VRVKVLDGVQRGAQGLPGVVRLGIRAPVGEVEHHPAEVALEAVLETGERLLGGVGLADDEIGAEISADVAVLNLVYRLPHGGGDSVDAGDVILPLD